MTDTIIAAIISGTLGISGAIIGVFFGNRMSKKTSAEAITSSNKNAVDIMRRGEFNRASAKIRASFAPAKVRLDYPRSLGNSEARKFFHKARTIHAAAIEEFRPFVEDNAAYQQAWDDYRKTVYKDDGMVDVDHKWSSGMIIPDGGDATLDFLDTINGKIDIILRFANPK